MFQTATELEWLLILISIAIIIFYYLTKTKNKNYFERLETYLLVALFSFLIFLKILDDVLTKGIITKIDFFVTEKIILIWNPFLINATLFLTKALNILLAFVIIFSVLYFIKIKKIERAALAVISFIIAYSSEIILKILIKINRPTDSLVNAFGYGFPSGHATVATTIFSLFIYCFYDLIKNKTKKLIFVLVNIFLILFIGFTRIYLNVHKFSDVVAGFSLGLFISSLLILMSKVLLRK